MSFTISVDQSHVLRTQSLPGALPVSTDNSSNFLEVICYPEWYDNITLQWSIPSSWGNCKFNVYFSPGGSETYSKLNPVLLSNPFFKDINTREYSKFANGNYVVEAVFPGMTRSVRSKPTFTQYRRRDKTDKVASEIQRREYLLLSKFAGVKSYYFRRRNYGLRCHRCWNQEQEKVMDDHCKVCYGTSWEGGYFDPTPVFIQFGTTPSSKARGYHGIVEANNIEAWTISVPEIGSEDIIIRTGDFNIYRVVSCTPTELQTRAVKQNLGLSQLSKTDVENDLSNRIEPSSGADYLKNIDSPFVEKRFPTNLIDKDPNNDYAWAKKQELSTLPKYSV
jgi:hypothetical protein